MKTQKKWSGPETDDEAMLSSAQSIIEYRGSQAHPDRLTRNEHAHYVKYVEQMLTVYRSGAGQTRREIHRSIAGIFANEANCPSKRIQAFCKLLDDASEFETDSHGNAATLRLRVFALAAPFHPLSRISGSLFGAPESEVKTKISRELGLSWKEIDRRLYADVIAFQQLVRFNGYGRAPNGYSDAEMLLRHYNVAQVQACLYRAEQMIITARQDFKRILRHIKFARLMFEIYRWKNSEYRIHLAGPMSILTETRRYGVKLAQIIPALLACENWEMEAVIQTPWRAKARFCLNSAEGLRSHLPASQEYDSEVEASFAAKFGEKRDGWSLAREAVVLHNEQATFVPDFVFRHDDGAEVLFEIVGFWTPQYLKQKRETLQQFRHQRILLAVHEDAITSSQTLPSNVIAYKTVIKIESVLQALKLFK